MRQSTQQQECMVSFHLLVIGKTMYKGLKFDKPSLSTACSSMFEVQTRFKKAKKSTITQQSTNMPENKFIMQGQKAKLYIFSL